jgi:hypothetical protein
VVRQYYSTRDDPNRMEALKALNQQEQWDYEIPPLSNQVMFTIGIK